MPTYDENYHEDIEELPCPDGWSLYHTGGGIMVWEHRTQGEPWFWMNGDDASVLPEEGKLVMLGLYQHETDEGDCRLFDSVDQAVVAVARYEREGVFQGGSPA